jgi:chromosome partitioning protein
MRVIAVINQKGGVGKTTTVVNLASYIARQGKRVVVVDADPQGNATSGLGLDKQQIEATLYDALFDKISVDKVIQPTVVEDVFILPTNANLAGAEVEMANEIGREMLLKKVVSQLSADIVLIDCPPSLGLLTVNALTSATDLLIPVQSEYYALEGISQLLQVMQRVQASLNPDLKILGVLMTMFDSRTSLSGQVEEEVKKHFGNLLFKTVVPRNVRLAEAPSHGKPISDYDKWSKGARAYKALAKEVLGRV